MRLYGYGHDFYSLALLGANVVFELCPASCPPNTQLIADAGGVARGASDAGTRAGPAR